MLRYYAYENLCGHIPHTDSDTERFLKECIPCNIIAKSPRFMVIMPTPLAVSALGLCWTNRQSLPTCRSWFFLGLSTLSVRKWCNIQWNRITLYAVIGNRKRLWQVMVILLLLHLSKYSFKKWALSTCYCCHTLSTISAPSSLPQSSKAPRSTRSQIEHSFHQAVDDFLSTYRTSATPSSCTQQKFVSTLWTNALIIQRAPFQLKKCLCTIEQGLRYDNNEALDSWRHFKTVFYQVETNIGTSITYVIQLRNHYDHALIKLQVNTCSSYPLQIPTCERRESMTTQPSSAASFYTSIFAEPLPASININLCVVTTSGWRTNGPAFEEQMWRKHSDI